MDGLELARQIRARRDSHVRLVALSGWGQEGDRARALQIFDTHLTKPVDLAVPQQHPPGESLVLDASAENIDNLLVVVFRADTGEVVFSNEPTEVQEIYDYTHGEGEKRVEII